MEKLSKKICIFGKYWLNVQYLAHIIFFIFNFIYANSMYLEFPKFYLKESILNALFSFNRLIFLYVNLGSPVGPLQLDFP